MVWDDRGDCTRDWIRALHDDVAPAAAHFTEAVLFMIRHTSRPERTRSLPTRRRKLRHEDRATTARPDLSGISRLEKEIDRLPEIGESLFD